MEHNASRSALYFPRSSLLSPPREEELTPVLKEGLSGRRGAIYLFQDGDLLITWNGAQKSLTETLCNTVYERFGHADGKDARYYDAQAQGEELRLLCRRKIEGMAGKQPDYGEREQDKATAFELTPKQAEYFRIARAMRRTRPKIELLVVEDQPFSAKLLKCLLGNKYRTHIAYSAEEALNMYVLYAPDIVLLDIELPGMNGHYFTEAVARLDELAYIVMVSANNYIEDVIRAKGNGVKGFVVKPYSRKKILNIIDNFYTCHQKKG